MFSMQLYQCVCWNLNTTNRILEQMLKERFHRRSINKLYTTRQREDFKGYFVDIIMIITCWSDPLMNTDVDIFFKHDRQTGPINICGHVWAQIHLFATLNFELWVLVLCWTLGSNLTCSFTKGNCKNIPIKLSYHTPNLNVKIFHMKISNLTYSYNYQWI